jgi:hypothetical protein
MAGGGRRPSDSRRGTSTSESPSNLAVEDRQNEGQGETPPATASTCFMLIGVLPARMPFRGHSGVASFMESGSEKCSGSGLIAQQIADRPRCTGDARTVGEPTPGRPFPRDPSRHRAPTKKERHQIADYVRGHSDRIGVSLIDMLAFSPNVEQNLFSLRSTQRLRSCKLLIPASARPRCDAVDERAQMLHQTATGALIVVFRYAWVEASKSSCWVEAPATDKPG